MYNASTTIFVLWWGALFSLLLSMAYHASETAQEESSQPLEKASGGAYNKPLTTTDGVVCSVGARSGRKMMTRQVLR